MHFVEIGYLLFEHSFQVRFDKLHYKEEKVQGLIVRRKDDVVQLGSKKIVLHLGELSENAYLSQNLLEGVVVIRAEFDQFDGADLIGMPSFCLKNSAIGTLSNNLCDRVFMFYII